jgi:hypothetical protein
MGHSDDVESAGVDSSAVLDTVGGGGDAVGWAAAVDDCGAAEPHPQRRMTVVTTAAIP